MAFVLTDEAGGRPTPPTEGTFCIPRSFTPTAVEAKVGINASNLYYQLIYQLQTHEDCSFASLSSAMEQFPMEASALSRAFTELRDKGFASLFGGNTLRTATAIRLNTFGELPR